MTEHSTKASDGQNFKEKLEYLGVPADKSHEPRRIMLLAAILKKCNNGRGPLTFNQIFDAFLEEIGDATFSKPWVHKVLQGLINQGFVKVINPNSYRKQYTANVNTVIQAFEQLRLQKLAKIQEEIRDLKERYRKTEQLDTKMLAKMFVSRLGGVTRKSLSGSIRGAQELHRIIDTMIYSQAKRGDIIRASIRTLLPFSQGVPERTMKLLSLVENGVHVRYLTSMNIIMSDLQSLEIPKKKIHALLNKAIETIKHVENFDARLFSSDEYSFEFVSLNDEQIVFIISQNPVLGAWMTKEFNADIIRNATRSFDMVWQKAVSMASVDPDQVIFGISTS